MLGGAGKNRNVESPPPMARKKLVKTDLKV